MYRWKQLNKLDVPKKEYHTKIKVISAGTIKSECTFLLVKITDQGDGYMRSEPVRSFEVTEEILEEADKEN